MTPTLLVRPVRPEDFDAWHVLWEGYNAFYGRHGATRLSDAVTRSTWNRFLDAAEPVHAFVAEEGDRLLGLAHTLFHRSTTRIGPVCYLQDLFTDPAVRGRGTGRALIAAAGEHARTQGAEKLYWQTHAGNDTARRLYDSVAQHDGFIIYEQIYRTVLHADPQTPA